MPQTPSAPSGSTRVAAFALAAAATVSLSPALAQDPVQSPPADWPMYSRDLAGTRFSPLTQITAVNVATLAEAWSVPVARSADDADDAPGPSGNPQATPIVVAGVMYLPVRGNQVLALDAATGSELWRSTLPAPNGTTARGVGYWPGDDEHGARILVTAGPTLVALDAATGAPARGFGQDGVVQIAVPWNGVPLVYEHLAILGATAGEVALAEPGDTRAFDVRTGEPVWSFHTVPLPDEKGHETWLDAGWRNRSGVNVWAWYMTLDAERGILYMPLGSAAGNYWGGDRPGDNLFANSIVAVDAATGRYRWHFQTVHHDLWDLDMPNPPVLLDLANGRRTRPALVSIGKTAYAFILDRVTGEPVFGVEERLVPAGSVPGEWYAPTQPFPVKPAEPLARVEFVKERDMVRPEDTSAQHAAACEALWEKSGGFHNAGPYTPFVFHAEGAPPRSSIQLPGAGGGVNWGGVAADPARGIVFAHAHDTSLVGWIETKRPGGNYGRGTQGSTIPYDRGSVDGAGPYFTFSAPLTNDAGETVATLPCTRPPWSRLVALDANTGEIVWQSTLGITEALPPEKQLTGGSGSAGPTATAGGLVFVGATNDRRFRAFDAATGAERWSVELEANVNANPMTYLGNDGRQYVAVVAGDTLVAFAQALPARLDAQDGAACGRACLADVLTRYLDSLVAHDPRMAPLADGARFTEDTIEMPVGEGLWKTASKLRPFRTDFLDVREGTAAVHAVIEENGVPVLFAARLKVVNRRITEIETMVVRNQQEGVLFAPDSLAQPSAAMIAAPPNAQLLPRDAMIELALRYPEGLRIGSFEESDVPFAPGAYRLENGVRMGGPGCTFQPPSCENLRSQPLPTLAEIEASVAAVDEENGTVLLRMDFGRGSLPGPQSEGQSLVTFEAFKIYGGQVHAVEAFFEGMPANTPSGWE
jgi:quinoprotein glucose dehydrogenase